MDRHAPIRRQRRGLARMAEILDAAARVFAAQGYDRATTNAIAAEAGISPGSLYRFFSSKEDIARALAERYRLEIGESHRGAFTDVDVTTPDIDDLLDRVVDPIIAFNRRNPAFITLFTRSDLPALLSSPVQPLEEAFAERLAQILTARNPALAPAEVARTARTAIQIFRGLIAGGTTPQDTAELKVVLRAYLTQKGIP